VTEKPSFRTAAAKRWALVPAKGYYEWQKNEDGTRTPHYLHAEDEDQLLGFAGLYEFWPDPTKAEDADDTWLVAATILTRAAHDALGHIHDRMPVMNPGGVAGSVAGSDHDGAGPGAAFHRHHL
jgi:putative SOS response-associated peptidase YedK